jgi:integrase
LVLDPRLYPALEAWLFDAGWRDDDADAEVDRAGGGVVAVSDTECGGGVGHRHRVGQQHASSDGYGVAGYRAALRPKHRRVFSRPNGEPWDVSELSRAFSRAAVRLTGKKTNPHLVRDMVITHVRGEGIASDAELEALSLYMGHSIAMQKGTYDRRTSAQKVAPAIGLMSAINARAAGGGGGSGGEKNR